MLRTIRLALLLLAGAASLSVQAFERPFPAHAVRGKMTPAYFPEVLIDGKVRQLAPSARIFNQENLIELPAAIRGSDLVVNYTVDNWGNIDRIWILTAEEAAQKPAASSR
ncbi:hypothetical protein ACFFKC_02295 [Pseudoduganella danionis]|uniref:hypothetical protein n=1 Tax=Pseudoduganella danionis TaxID=1890295 RepID=UPI001E3B8DDF|nr:hypothetical protein [Pseudoduganella danionis]